MDTITKVLIRLFSGILVLTIIIVFILSHLSLKTLNLLIVFLGVIVLIYYLKVKNDFGTNIVSMEYLDKKQTELNDAEYLKWLRAKYVALWAQALEKKKKGLVVSQESINQAVLLEKEIDTTRNRTGEPKTSERRFSDEFSNTKNVGNYYGP